MSKKKYSPDKIGSLELLKYNSPGKTILGSASGRLSGARAWRIDNLTILTVQAEGNKVRWALRFSSIFGDIYALANRESVRRFFENLLTCTSSTKWSSEDERFRGKATSWLLSQDKLE